MYSRCVYLLIVTIATICPPGRAAKPKANFFVAPEGNDRWSGRLPEPNAQRSDGPLATISGAQQAVRRLISEQPRRQSPVVVAIRGGEYRLSEPIVFQPQDSGTPDCPIRYEAYGDEQPVFSGGRRIGGWKQVAAGLWAARVPEVKAGKWYFHQLFVDGRRAVRARGPNTGFYEALKPIQPKSGAGFYFEPGHIKNWGNLDDVDVILLHHWDESHLPVASVDEDANLVRFIGEKFHYYAGWRDASRYYVENVFEEMDAPGEWYLNRETGLLYYRPRVDQDMRRAEVIAPVLTTLLCFAGDKTPEELVSDVQLKGLAFRHADWVRRDVAFTEGQAAVGLGAAVEMKGAVRCSLEDCQIAHVGNNAIWLRSSCQKNQVMGCDLHDLGAGGVMIGQMSKVERDIEEARENLVADCHIHHGGIVWHSGVAVWINRSGHNRVAHNHVHDFHYTGISVGMQWRDYDNRCRDNIVEFNHIHHVCNVMSDGGGIYTMGNMPGTVLRNNLIHDIYGCRINRGIFLDGASGGILVRDNVVYRTLFGPLDPYTENTTTPNIYVNNIWAFPKNSQMAWNRRADCSNRAHHNIVYGVQAITFQIVKKRPPEKYANLVNDNLYWHPQAAMTFNKQAFDRWQATGFDTRSVVADPLFADPQNGDFSLPADSPAINIGFKPIDTSMVGPRRTQKWR